MQTLHSETDAIKQVSPNVIVYFLSGASGDHVFMDYYPSENEDFAAADSSKLDTWVFDKVKVSLG